MICDALKRVDHALRTGLHELSTLFLTPIGRLHESIALKTAPKTLTWLATALVLLVAGMAYNFWPYQQISKTSSQRHHSRWVINMASNLFSDLKDVKLGQSGYLLTRNVAYLAPYLQVDEGINGWFGALHPLSSSPQARDHLNAMAPLVSAGLNEFARSIDLRRASNPRATPVLATHDAGKRLMDQIRTEMDGIIAAQTNVRFLSDINFDATLRRLFVTLVSSSALAFLFALFVARLMHQRSQQRNSASRSSFILKLSIC